MAINVSTLDSALASKDRSAISGSHQSNHGGRLQYSVSFSKGSEGSSIYLWALLDQLRREQLDSAPSSAWMLAGANWTHLQWCLFSTESSEYFCDSCFFAGANQAQSPCIDVVGNAVVGQWPILADSSDLHGAWPSRASAGESAASLGSDRWGAAQSSAFCTHFDALQGKAEYHHPGASHPWGNYCSDLPAMATWQIFWASWFPANSVCHKTFDPEGLAEWTTWLQHKVTRYDGRSPAGGLLLALRKGMSCECSFDIMWSKPVILCLIHVQVLWCQCFCESCHY